MPRPTQDAQPRSSRQKVRVCSQNGSKARPIDVTSSKRSWSVSLDVVVLDVVLDVEVVDVVVVPLVVEVVVVVVEDVVTDEVDVDVVVDVTVEESVDEVCVDVLDVTVVNVAVVVLRVVSVLVVMEIVELDTVVVLVVEDCVEVEVVDVLVVETVVEEVVVVVVVVWHPKCAIRSACVSSPLPLSVPLAPLADSSPPSNSGKRSRTALSGAHTRSCHGTGGHTSIAPSVHGVNGRQIVCDVGVAALATYSSASQSETAAQRRSVTAMLPTNVGETDSCS
mmetsp:Transcript_21342/g.55713  ORF Transcript_21342/g.55713 Transcript_21342/m.55713 type:complete len:279 (+) Transcript_21342:892-1728(+)